MKWTRAQQETIETRDRNILVSAAAGSGKTTVLIERIKQLVLRDRVDIDRFLITTFTNAAAAEMKEKMQRAIHQEMDRISALRREEGKGALDRSLKETRAYLQRQLELLPQASISTFHTFALGIMRDYFYLTDLQPGFSIGDETRLSILRREAADQVFEEGFASGSDAFRRFLRSYSSDRSDERLKQQLLQIYQELRSIPRYLDWARDRTGLMSGPDPLHALGIDHFLLTETEEALTEAIRWYAAAADLLDREETGSLCLKARQDEARLRELLAEAGTGMGQEDPAALFALLEKLGEELRGFRANVMRAGKGEKDAYEVCRDEVGFLRKQGKKCLDQLRQKYYVQPLEEADRILQENAEDTAYFVSLIEKLEEIYREKKQALNLVDFDDCMHCCIQILEDEKAAADVRERYRYIFIDEYQDSNLLQEEIVGRIAREDNLFMVGDVKQSIYKFRLAEPEIFRRRYDLYRSGADPRSIRIDLNSNFRSRQRVREAVNRIFERIMDGYDEDARLHGPDREEGMQGDPVRLHIISKTDPEMEETADPQEILEETALIAGIIRETLGCPMTDRDGTVRPISCGDIAVLSRGSAAIPRIERYLNNDGIPAFGETGGGYYETVEIQTFLDLLRVISNLQQDVPLISAMRSVIFDFSPAQLARIRIEYPDGSYVGAVRRYASGGSDAGLREKIRSMLDQITLWKEMSRTLPLDELMRILLYETGYYDYCSGLPVGDQRVSNLRLLLEKAAAYEETSYLGLYGFLSYVEVMRRTGQKVSEASLASEGKDVVRVMTVHKSKGLEFPVVILAGAGHRISGASEGRAPAMHKDLAIGLAQVDREGHWERRTLLQKAIAGRKRRESLEEEIRILYVALTRPMQRLEIVGTIRDAGRLQRFPGKGSFLEMVYGSLMEMMEEDPAAAQVLIHRSSETEEEDGFIRSEGRRADLYSGRPGPGLEIDPAELDRRLSWRYPYADQQQIRNKYSVTDLAVRAGGQAEETADHRIPQLREPRAGAEDGREVSLTAAEIGTALHTVMERINFAAALEGGLPYIRKAVEELHASGFLTDAEHRLVRPDHIHGFFRTPVGKRAARAETLCREKEFLMEQEIEGVPAIVQGIIDCYFEDGQGLVLVDYKNSWAGSETEEAVLVRRYAGQIRLYRKALELALGRKVDEAWLYLFRSGRCIAIDTEDDGGRKEKRTE